MKISFALVALTVLSLFIASAYAGATASSCLTAYDACVAYAGESLPNPTCECAIQYRSCMRPIGQCAANNATDLCGVKCSSACGSSGSDCTPWPPTGITATCDSGIEMYCAQQYDFATNSSCYNEIGYRQCLLAADCPYSRGSSCTTACTGRNTSFSCSDVSPATVQVPSNSACFRSGYVSSGDCTCTNDIRDIDSSLTCANGTWTKTGDLTLADKQVILDTDKLRVVGNLIVQASSNISISYDDATKAQGSLEVTGSITLNGQLLTFVSGTAASTSVNFTVATYTSITAADFTRYQYPPPPSGFCFVTRVYDAGATKLTFLFTLAASGGCAGVPPAVVPGARIPLGTGAPPVVNPPPPAPPQNVGNHFEMGVFALFFVALSFMM